ncbi:MAG: outer membrane beta-barrel protein, partial [Ginsengibacter sp.]
MKKFAALFIAGLLFTFWSSAQTATVSGKVKDADEDKPIANAVVALFTPKDSILYSFTRTDTAGNYLLKNVKPGNYILMTSHPYYADLLYNIDAKNDTKLPVTSLVSKGKLLQEVIIKSGTPFRIKGDTTVYTADSFKVGPNANVEELLKKLPGIQVDKDGQIKAMGETVQKVLVDGEEFFGDDPGMAVKNLRADAVKEVQVYDKKSDQAEFTGIDDGKTQKTINLKLKDNKKTGFFGKADVSAGPEKDIDNRYNNNLMFSSFKGKRKLSAFFLNGNTGQDGLNWQDEQKYSSDEDISIDVSDDGNLNFTWTGSSDDEPNVDTRNGYITNINAGVQYNNKWNDQYNLNLSPKYNSQQYLNHQSTFTQSQIGDSVLNTNSNETMDVNRHNFKLRGVVDIKFDSANSLKITANNNIYHTESNDLTNSQTLGNTGTLKNTSDRQLQTNSDKNALSGNFIFKHKFHKSRRTLSFTGNWYSLDNTGTDFLKSSNEAYFNGQPSGSLDLDQRKDYEQSTKNLSASLVYTEPLSKTLSLLLGYQLSYNYGTNDQLTYNYTNASGKYDNLVDSLSNDFKQNILQNIPSAKINFSSKKLKMNIGSGIGFTHFDLKDITFDKDYLRDYTNFYPSANVTYTYKPNHNIRLYYNGNTVQPSVDQLQPLRNNNDYFNQVIGNPALKPAFNHSVYLTHSSYNFLRDLFTYQSLSAYVQQNA